MSFQRLLELCELLHECNKLPPGWFRLWARANAIRQMRALLFEELGREHLAQLRAAR